MEKYQTETERISRNIPVLQEVVNATWSRENELKERKTELSALNRKIDLSLKPVDTGEDKKEHTQEHNGSIKDDSDYAALVPKTMRKTIIPRALL